MTDLKMDPDEMELDEIIIEEKEPENLTISSEGLNKSYAIIERTIAKCEALKRLATEASQETILKLSEELSKELYERLEEYRRDHRDAFATLDDPEKLEDFARELTPEDLSKYINIDQAANQSAGKVCSDDLRKIEKEDFVQLYEEKHKKKKYRTKAKSGTDNTNTKNGPPIISLERLKYALAPHREGDAYLEEYEESFTREDGPFTCEGGKIYAKDERLRPLTEMQLENIQTKKIIGNSLENSGKLNVFFWIIYEEYEKSGYTEIPKQVTMYLPDLAERLGLTGNMSKKEANIIKGLIASFHNVAGVIHVRKNGIEGKERYQVLLLHSDSEVKNTVTFSSPYMEHLIEVIEEARIRKRGDKTQYKKNGLPQTKPAYSWLAKESLFKQQNGKAIANVLIILILIEQTGKGTPNISFNELIRRNDLLREALERDPKHINQELKRVFNATYEYLEKHTKLKEEYIDIQIPNTIPSKRTLDGVLKFPHKGKRKTAAKEAEKEAKK